MGEKRSSKGIYILLTALSVSFLIVALSFVPLLPCPLCVDLGARAAECRVCGARHSAGKNEMRPVGFWRRRLAIGDLHPVTNQDFPLFP